jgi:DNA-binding CsgD family transcriptional regulator/PAS domain-containing protein
MSEEREIGLVAELVGQLYRAAWQGSWLGVLEELVRALEVEEVQIVVHRGRRWDVLMSSAGKRSPGPVASSWAGRDVRLVTRPDPAPREGIRRAIERLVPQVLDLARQRELERTRDSAIRSALDRLEVGVVLLDEGGKVAQINRAAAEVLGREPQLHAEVGDGLSATDPEIQRELSRMVARMVGASHDPSMRASEHLELPRPSMHPLRLLFVPLQGEGRASGRACALFVSDRELGIELPEEVVRRHYGLTPGEARVVARLLRGRDIDGVAEELKVTRETVRSHLKRVYGKVGTTRQSELVALVLRGPAGLRWD